MQYNNEKRLLIGRRLAIWGIAVNLILFTAKLIASLLSNSLAATADAFNNLTDASASVISYIGFKLSGKGADREHPYGHARAEYISAFIVAMIIILIGFEFTKTSIKAILSPQPIRVTGAVFAIMLASVAAKAVMAAINYSAGKKINSKALLAAFYDSRNDALITLCVILGYIISDISALRIDGFLSLLVAVIIFAGGINLIRETLGPLLGKAPDKELVDMIHAKILSYPDILGAHDLVVHDYGTDRIFASVHVEMAAEKGTVECHDIIDSIERDFFADSSIRMTIHLDPITTCDCALTALRAVVTDIAAKIHTLCTIHDLRFENNIISFDCIKPENCLLSDDALITAFDVSLRLLYPDCTVKVTVDSSFSPVIK